jgi:hypothetical protein
MKTPGLSGFTSADGARHTRCDAVTFASAAAVSMQFFAQARIGLRSRFAIAT